MRGGPQCSLRSLASTFFLLNDASSIPHSRGKYLEEEEEDEEGGGGGGEEDEKEKEEEGGGGEEEEEEGKKKKNSGDTRARFPTKQRYPWLISGYVGNHLDTQAGGG
ncbi:hypothetical protein M8J77_007885 [Diaphorina citri]|nr:hypothetical protein M8J77_007885 [Diaphorina citri]